MIPLLKSPHLLPTIKNYLTIIKSPLTQKKKDSPWIYASKHDQLRNRQSGFISVYTHVNNDTHNASLRFIQHVERAHIILTNATAKIHQYLSSLSNKQRYAYTTKQSSTTTLSSCLSPTSLQSFRSSIQTKSMQLQTQNETSKFIQMQKQLNKQKKQTHNNYIQQQLKQLKIFMEVKLMENQLKSIKQKQGFPPIFQISDHTLSDIQKIHHDGFHLLFIFCDDQDNIIDCGKIIKLLQTKQLPYQILPCSDNLITAIVSSGLPADRFSLQNFPLQNLQVLLTRRSTMKITTCIQIEIEKLDLLVKSIIKILGKEHIVYLHGQQDKFYRGEVYGLQTYLNTNFPTTSTVYLVLAPRIPQFNQGLKSQLNIKSHILGELQSNKLNEVQMSILIKKLNALSKKQYIYQIDSHLMTAQLLSRIQDQNIVKQCLKILLPRKSQFQIQFILNQAKKSVVVDYVGIKDALKGEK